MLARGWTLALTLVLWPFLVAQEAAAEAIVLPPYWSLAAAQDKACRGLYHFDNSHKHYLVRQGSDTLESCQEWCQSNSNCTGIEFSAVHGQRCEIWVRPYGVGATVDVANFVCLRFGTPKRSPTDFARRGPWVDCNQEPCYEWSLADGGEGRVCRGANTTDDGENYYVLHEGTPTLDDCLGICNGMNAACSTGLCDMACSGIEYHPVFNEGRCEVWTRPGYTNPATGIHYPGVGATTAKDGFVCMRFQAIGDRAQR